MDESFAQLGYRSRVLVQAEVPNLRFSFTMNSIDFLYEKEFAENYWY